MATEDRPHTFPITVGALAGAGAKNWDLYYDLAIQQPHFPSSAWVDSVLIENESAASCTVAGLGQVIAANNTLEVFFPRGTRQFTLIAGTGGWAATEVRATVAIKGCCK